MSRFLRLSLVLFVALTFSTLFAPLRAEAATRTVNFKGTLEGGQLGVITFDFDITRDFSVRSIGFAYPDDTTGLIMNSLTSSVLAGDPIALSAGFGYQ